MVWQAEDDKEKKGELSRDMPRSGKQHNNAESRESYGTCILQCVNARVQAGEK